MAKLKPYEIKRRKRARRKMLKTAGQIVMLIIIGIAGGLLAWVIGDVMFAIR